MEHRGDRPILFAVTDHRAVAVPFGVLRGDRRSHIYLIGKTGTGKTTLIRSLIEQDIARGEGLALFDPHGDLVETLRPLAMRGRETDVLFLDVPDRRSLWHFNPLAGIPRDRHAVAVAGMVESLRKIWPDDWGPRLEHLVRNVLFALLEYAGASFADIPPLLTNRRFRQEVVARVSNEEVRAFWLTEYARYSPAFRAVVTAPFQNKIGALLTDPLLRSIFAAPKSTLDIPSIMNEGKVLLVNLAKGRIGEGPASLLGSLLVSAIAQAGLARADQPERERRDFWVYLDEFHTFGTLSLATMLSELRKYRVGLVVANQYLSQLSPQLRDAVIGNAGTLIAFRVGGADARFLASEFGPRFSVEDLVALPNYHMYLKLMIDGEVSRPFSAQTIPPPKVEDDGREPMAA